MNDEAGKLWRLLLYNIPSSDLWGIISTVKLSAFLFVAVSATHVYFPAWCALTRGISNRPSTVTVYSNLGPGKPGGIIFSDIKSRGL